MTETWRGVFEFLGLAMLAASLVFVAFQMQQDRKIALGLNSGLESDAYLSMYANLYGTKAWNAEGLSELEIAAAEIDAQIWLTYMEMGYEHYAEGMGSEAAWSELRVEIKAMLAHPAYRAVFDVLWKAAPSEFTRTVDAIIDSKKVL
jgi:hypothetical protein